MIHQHVKLLFAHCVRQILGQYLYETTTTSFQTLENFYVLLTMLDNDQLDTHLLYLQYVYYNPLHSLVRSQMVSLQFFIDIIVPIALWPWGRLRLWQKWVPRGFPGGKCGRCLRLTTLPPPCAVVMKSGNLNFLEPSGPLQACNGTDLPLPYVSSIICLSSGGWTLLVQHLVSFNLLMMSI